MLTAETGGALTLACILILTVSWVHHRKPIPAIWPATAWAAGAFSPVPGHLPDSTRAGSRPGALTTDEVLLGAVMGHAKNLAAVMSQ